jgi:hypothetical protein
MIMSGCTPAGTRSRTRNLIATAAWYAVCS